MLVRLLTCLLLLLAAATGLLGAGEQEPIHAGPVYTSLTVFPEVRVLVTVPTTAKPEAVKPESFTLKVDGGAPAPGTVVQSLAETGLGMAAVVLLDVSGSMAGGPINAIRGGLVKFTSEATLGDRVAICTVADETRWDANWNDTPDQLKAALAGLKPRGKLTRLWDGLLEVIAKYPDSPTARRLVLISDGHDEGSTHTLDEVLTAAAQNHVVVDSIGMTRSDPKFLANLARLSAVTGGLHRPAPTLTILEQLVGGGIKRYRTIPVVTFRAEGVTADGKPHTFQVAWNSGAGPELQSQVESTVPDDPKPALPVLKTEQPVASKTQPPVDEPPAQTKPATKGFPPKMLLYIGAGALVALLVGLVAFLSLRKRKPAASPAIPQNQQPFPFPAQQPFQPRQAPPQQGSVYMPLPASPPPPEPAPEPKPMTFAPAPPPPPPQPQQPVRPPTWFNAPTKQNPSAWLVCIEGALTGKSFPIDDGQYWLGANPNNHLPLVDDATVSGNHACIAFENDSLALYDHHSTNGLFVNDERVGEARRILQPGDRIRVGRSIFILRPPHAAA